MSQLEYNKRYKAKHRRLGLCLTCSRKATDGFLHCRVCRARERELGMARYPLFCSECRKLIKPEERHYGARFHKLCAQRRKARIYPQQHRSATLAYQRRHKKLGLCKNCSRKAFRWGLCRQHFTIAKESYDKVMGLM